MIPEKKLNEYREKLADFKNAKTRGSRFFTSSYTCPECGHLALADNWPPNYGGGSGCGTFQESHGSQKCVCVPCKIAFRVSEVHKQKLVGMSMVTVEHNVTYSENVPLVLGTVDRLKGKLLTPTDVSDEKYFKEHGKFPRVAYV